MKINSKLFFLYTFLIVVFLFTLLEKNQAQPMPYVEKQSESFILPLTNSKMCHASTILELSNGDIMAAWFEGSYEGAKDVSICSSIFHNHQWSIPIRLVVGIDHIKTNQNTPDTFACWNPVLFKAPDQTIYLYYKVGKSPQEWWGEYICSKDDGKTWSPLKKTNILNPNSGIDAITQQNGVTYLVNNPTEIGKEWVNGRHKLIITISFDGSEWFEVYYLENEETGEYSYPAIIKTSDGLIHITYTYNRKTIKHIIFKSNF